MSPMPDPGTPEPTTPESTTGVAPTAAAGVRVRIPTILRTYTGGAGVVTVSPVVTGSAATVAEVITSLEDVHPGIRARVLDELGQVRRFVNVYIDDDDIRFGDGLQTPVAPGATLSIIPAVAGG